VVNPSAKKPAKRGPGRPRQKRRKKLTDAELLESAAQVEADVITFFEGPTLPMTITYRGPKVIFLPFIVASCHLPSFSFTYLPMLPSPHRLFHTLSP
jgi:hypothetical protein